MDTKCSYTEKLEVEVAKKKEELTAYEPYTPDEMFRFKGENIFSVEDFWQYAYSQLDGMAETIAEFLVAKALGIKKAENVNYWTAYDMAYRNKRIKINKHILQGAEVQRNRQHFDSGQFPYKAVNIILHCAF